MKRLLQIAVVIVAVAAGIMLLTRTPAPDIAISEVTALRVPGAPHTAMITLTISNPGGPDRLIDAQSDAAQLTTLKSLQAYGLPVPGSSAVSLSMEAGHIVIMGLAQEVQDGALIPLTLQFDRAGEIVVKARVGSGGMMHDQGYEVPAGEAPPVVSISTAPDEDGWVVTLSLTGMELSQELVDQPHQPGTGHGHLYLDGMKLGRVFDHTARIGPLAPGRYTVEVVLNTNDHRAYRVDGKNVSATAEIVVD